MCKVSVVVPVFNAEKTLRACLTSLSVQTLDDIEIIIVNDGSTDNSLAIAKEYANNNPCFIVFSTANMGVSHARNYGAEQSHGDYLAFVDSDDVVEPNYCSAMYEKAIRDGNDLVVCGFDKITVLTHKNKPTIEIGPIIDIDNCKMADCPEQLISIWPGPWDKLISRYLFEMIRFPEEIGYAEDQVYSTKAFCLSQSIGKVEQILYHYYDTHSGITSRFGAERLDWLLAMDELYDFMQVDGVRGILDRELEFFIIEKSIRLCSSALLRLDSPWELRAQLSIGIFTFIHDHFPNWRKNKYYINDLKIRTEKQLFWKNYLNSHKSSHALYCNYGMNHFLLLIKLSSILPKRLYYCVLLSDLTTFSVCRWIRWRFTNPILNRGAILYD